MRFGVKLAVVALLAFALRVAFIVIVAPTVPKIGDASAYHLLAENLAHGRGYIRPFDWQLLGRVRPTAEYPPLFPAVLSVFARLSVHSVESQRFVGAAIGSCTVAFVGLIGRRVATPTVGLVAAVLAAISPMLFLSEAILMAETLYVALVALALLLAYRALEAPSYGRFAALGAAIGLATLTRAEGLLLGLILVIPLCVRLRRGMFAVTAIGVAVLVVVPWTVRNAAKFHSFVPVSNNVATLVDGANCDATYGGTLLGLWKESFSGSSTRVDQPQAQACFEGFNIGDPNFDEVRASRMHLRAGIHYADHHIGALPKVAAVRVLRTWGLYAPGQQVNFESLEGRPRHWEWAGTILDWILLPFAIYGVVLLARRRVPIWPLVSTAVTVVIMAALTYGQQRFRVAAEPAIIVGAAVAFIGLWPRPSSVSECSGSSSESSPHS
jgi:4-amino-4-deoxy-L-arabinose transferase-like glycosyltransferase